MKNFEFKSQICTDINQSRKLLELGLKKETADCGMYWSEMEERWIYFMQNNKAGILCSLCEDEIPAWSLHRLVEMYTERYLACSVNLKIFTYEWLINEIEIHIKEGDFNKDYLEEQKK